MEVVSDKAVNRRAIYYCSIVEVRMIDDDDNNDRCGDIQAAGRQFRPPAVAVGGASYK